MESSETKQIISVETKKEQSSAQGKGAFFPGKRSKNSDAAGQCCKGDCKN